MTAQTRNQALNWVPSIGTENLCGFASFDAPIQALRYNGLLASENRFFAIYSEELARTNHANVRLRNATAIKAAFAKSILEDNSGLDTPFDTNIQQILNPNVQADPFYADFIPNFLEQNRDQLQVHRINYEINRRNAAFNDGEARNIDGAGFYNYLKLQAPELIQSAKQTYCNDIINPNNAYRARTNDMIYMARKIGSFAEVYVHHNEDQVNQFTLNPAGVDLHIRNVQGNHWEAASLDLPQPDLGAQPEPTHINNNLFFVFGNKLPNFEAFLADPGSEISLIANNTNDYISRTQQANELLDNSVGSIDMTALNRLFP